MCGRFGLSVPTKTLATFLKLKDLPEQRPRYNIAPTTGILAVLSLANRPGERLPAWLHWGLVPAWSANAQLGGKLINARAETLREKPSFRGSFAYQRCLVPISGFYEWQQHGSRKTPMYISSAREEPLVVAGLWAVWVGTQGEELHSCALITTAANDFMAPIHERMPAFLHPDQFDLWLDPRVQNPDQVGFLLKPCPSDWLQAWPVSAYVNRIQNEGPQCCERVSEPPPAEASPQQLSLF